MEGRQAHGLAERQMQRLRSGASLECLWLLLILIVGGAAGFAASTAYRRAALVRRVGGAVRAPGGRARLRGPHAPQLAPVLARAPIQEIPSVAALYVALGLMVPSIDNAEHVRGSRAASRSASC